MIAITEKTPLVSIIIPTFNSSKTLEKVLSSIDNQTYPNIEVIIVDNNSTDSTANIAVAHKADFFQIKAGRSKARNYGVLQASGTYLLFLDSDIQLSSKVIEECEKTIRKGFDAIILPEIIVGEGFWAKCRALEAECYLSDPAVIVCPRFFKKEAFKKLNGYDERLEAGEDWDIRERLKGKALKMCQITALTMHDEGKVRLSHRLRKKYFYGFLMDEYLQKYKGNSVVTKQIPFFRSAYLKQWKLLVKNPLYASGFLFMKTMETSFVASAFILRKLNKH